MANNQIIMLTLNDLPQNKVTRIDNKLKKISCYCQVQSMNFQFNNYDSGTRQLKKKYGISKEINKYFTRRFFFFEKFEEGIQLDQESWFSVIPEPVSHYLCKRFQESNIKKIFEPFCGVGGIAIHLAGKFDQYVVNDIDKKKIKMLKNNLKVYGKKSDTLDFCIQDFLKIQPFNTDALIICPPWGGVDLSDYSQKDLDEIMNPRLTDILNHANKFSPNVMLQMPKNTNIENLLKVVLECQISPVFTIEKIMTNGKVSQLFIYFGSQSFTMIQNSQLCACLYADLNVDEQQKKKKKELKKRIKQDSFALLKQVYLAHNPNNKHIFF